MTKITTRSTTLRFHVERVAGLGFAIFTVWGGEVSLWKCSKLVGAWKNRKAYDAACQRARAALAA